MMDFDATRALALALPGVEEGSSYGTPAFRVAGQLFARFHQDGTSLVLRARPDQRDELMQRLPGTFFVTDHYRDRPWVLVRLADVERDDLTDALEQAWRLRAPRRLVDDWDASS